MPDIGTGMLQQSGDLETLGEVFDDNIRAHIAGNHAMSGDYVGKEAVFAVHHAKSMRQGPTVGLFQGCASCGKECDVPQLVA